MSEEEYNSDNIQIADYIITLVCGFALGFLFSLFVKGF